MEDFHEEPNEAEPSFSLKDFKKWMSQQHQPPAHERKRFELSGLRVESKLGLRRLVTKMAVEDGDNVVELAREFRRYGGVILEVNEENIALIEVDSGTFCIPRFFVRKIKE